MRLTSTHPSRRSRNAPRRGVVLLVVLTLLSLFVVICTTFVLVASQYNRAAISQARDELYRDPPQKLVDAAMYQLLRGTRDMASAMNMPNLSVPDPQDLLADMYGFDGFIAYALIREVAPDARSITIRVPSPPLQVNAMGQVPPAELQATGDPRFGDLIYWRSVRDRALPYFYQNPQPSTTAVQMPAFPGFFGGNLVTFIEARDLDKPLINVTGRVISYDIVAEPDDDPFPYATMTVSWSVDAYDNDLPLPGYFAGLQNRLNNGDVIPVRILMNGRPFNGDGSPNAPDESYDAFDDLNRFLADVTDPMNPDRMSLRGAIAAAPGLVDNDGDGIPDGFWVNLNFPAQTTEDGRLYRPLFSFHCLDLDGRINLNFHGSRSHLEAHTTQVKFAGTNVFNNNRVFGNPFPSEAHGRGSSYGVADINPFDALAELVNDYAQRRNPPLNLTAEQVSEIAHTWYRQLLEGRNIGIQQRGRYGPQLVPGVSGVDLLSPQRFVRYLPPELQRSLLDFHSAYALGMDRRGMPLFQPPYKPEAIVDSPYETNILAPRGSLGAAASPNRKDELFSYEELEDILRFYDWDVMNRPSRLRFLSEVRYDADGDGNVDTLSFYLDPELRKLITTESWDMPVPNIQQPRPGDDGSRMAAFTELLFHRVMQFMPPPQDPEVARGIVRQLVNDGIVAPELVRGQRLELNRPLLTPQDKQLFAAQLYLLMMVVGNVNPAEVEEVHRVAQWAVNVVDFSDRDAAMTRFEYDRNPFNGWPIQGNPELSTTWGCERPELLISEVIAFHDSRVELEADGTPRQVYRPRGSLFVELYNPWATPYFESDLNRFPNMGIGVDGGVQLNAVAPGNFPIWRLEIDVNRQVAEIDQSHQRWVYFTAPPPGLVQAAPNPQMVYFSDLPMAPITPGNYGVVGSVGWVGDPDDPNNSFDIDVNDDNSPNYVTTLGMRDTDISPGAVDYEQARKFEFSMDNYPFVTGASPVPFLTQVDLRTSLPRPVVGAVINRFYRDLGTTEWRSLNVTEPLDGYLSNETNQVVVIADPAERKYASAPQVAFDPDELMIAATFKLQRLADPTVPFNAAFNPYVTVDTTEERPLLVANADPGIRWFRGTDREADSLNIPSRERVGTLWSANELSWQPGPPGPVVPAGYIFNGTVDQTFGFLNSGFGNFNTAPDIGPSPPQSDPAFYVGAPNVQFPWLTWHNRPFTNQYELLQVPATNAEMTLRTFRTPQEIDAGLGAERPHLLEFVNPTVGPPRRYHHVLEYTHVRSRFLGSEVYSNTGERLPRYREPGRVNINTIPYEAVWESLWNGRELSGAGQPSWIPLFAEVVAERPFQTPILNSDWNMHRFLRDFASNNSLFSTGVPYPRGNYPHYNGQVHGYYRYAALNRLGSLITTRSNMFAVWITVGYFEVDSSNGEVVQELGVDTGDVERHRGFYLIDRTIPVGYEPGENHNVDRAVVLRRFIE